MKKIILSVTATALILAGCSASTGSDSVSKTQVENQIIGQIAAKTGKSPGSVTCPSNLPAKVDATIVCTLVGTEGEEYNVTVTVTSVEDGNVQFDIASELK